MGYPIGLVFCLPLHIAIYKHSGLLKRVEYTQFNCVEMDSLKYQLGTEHHHTTLEGELVDIILGAKKHPTHCCHHRDCCKSFAQ